MNNKRTIPIIFILLIGITFGVYYLFFINAGSSGNPLLMIPDTPAVFIETYHPNVLYENLSGTNNIWKDLSETSVLKPLNHDILTFDSLFRTDQKLLKSIGSSLLYICLFHDNQSNKNQLLLFSKLQSPPKLEYLKNFLQQQLGPGFAILYDNTGEYPMLKILDGKDGTTAYLSLVDGVLLFTHHRSLLERSWATYVGGKNFYYNDSSFQKLVKTAGKNVAARIYIHYPSLVQVLSKAVAPGFIHQFQKMKNFAQWSEVDLLVKNNEIILTGYTIAKNNTGTLSKFRAQHPAKTNALSLFPFNTNMSISLGFSDFNQYASATIPGTFKLAYQSDIQQFIKQTGKEVCYVSNALTDREVKNKSWAVIGIKNLPESKTLLKNIAYKSGYKKYSTYGSHIIRKINIPSLLKTIYGEVFKGISKNYYTFLNGYVVFANSRDAIIQLIQYNETGKTLDLNENFKSFSDNIDGSSNILLNLKIRSLQGLMDRYLSHRTAQAVQKHVGLLNNFQGLVIQYSRDASMFYTNIYLRYNKSYKEENLALWKAKLRDDIVGKPFLVKDHKSGNYDIIVFDKGNRMYLINPKGKILWTKLLPALPISKIYPVDYYKNGKIQFLFNTSQSIFLIDRNGNKVANYPIRLQPVATNGLSLFDYTDRKDYRILLAQADNQIYDYTIKGKQVRGWIKPRMQNTVIQKIVRLLANHKDYIIITDISGNVKIVNRRGSDRIYLKDEFQKAKHSTYFVNRTNSKGIILTSNTKGQVVYLSTKGKTQVTDFGKFSPQHYFLYEDFNGNFSDDFIFIDHNNLSVFNRFKKELFSYNFPSEIHVQPEFFTLGRNRKVLGVVASQEKTIYLFDKDGNILISTGLTGETPFTVGSLFNNEEINLITASGNTLFNYRIK